MDRTILEDGVFYLAWFRYILENNGRQRNESPEPSFT